VTVLTRIKLEPQSQWTYWCLRNPVAIHRRVMRAFPEIDQSSPRQALQVLWRLDAETGADRRPSLLVQSRDPGSWETPDNRWATSIETKEIDAVLDKLRDGQRCRFLLRANATRKIATKASQDGRHHNGQRVPIRSVEGALEWLKRKGQSAGFELAEEDGVPLVRVDSEPKQTGKRDGAIVTVEATRFEGELVVTDVGKLIESIRSGIGPAKAYGCGLLSVVPLPK